jgi:tetratricopeptide (TPR) repeat protein
MNKKTLVILAALFITGLVLSLAVAAYKTFFSPASTEDQPILANVTLPAASGIKTANVTAATGISAEVVNVTAVDPARLRLEKSLQDALTQLNRFKAENDEIRRRMVSLESTGNALSVLNSALRQENENLKVKEGTLAETMVKLARMEARIIEADKQNKELSAKLDEYAGEIDISKRKIEEMAAENKRIKDPTTIPALETRIAEYQARLTAADDKFKKSALKIASAVKEKNKLVEETALLHYNLGVTLFKSRDYDKAAKEFRRSIELNPLMADAYYNLGVTYDEYIGDARLALFYYKAYLELDPASAQRLKISEKILHAQLKVKAMVDSPLEQPDPTVIR